MIQTSSYSSESFRFYYRAACALAMALPIYAIFYFSFVDIGQYLSPEELELRTAVYWMLVSHSLAFLYSYAAAELTLIAFVALGPMLYFAFPKVMFLTLYPEDLMGLSPMSTRATELFTECWLMLFFTYIAARAVIRILSEKKVFSLEAKTRAIAPPIPQVAWNSAFFMFVFFGFYESSVSPQIRTACAVCILSTRPPKQYIHPLFISSIVLLLCVYDFLQGGFIATAFCSSFLILFSGITNRIKSNMIMGALGLLAFSYMQVVKYEYRSLLENAPNLSFEDRIKIIEFWVAFKVATSTATEDNSKDDDQPPLALRIVSGGLVDRNVLQRFHDDSLERTMEYVPGREPFWAGRTLKRLPFFFIPRFLWPNKPSRDFLNEFGHIFGYLGQDDTNTSIGFNFLCDGYLNFGYPGLYGFAEALAIITVLLEMFSKFILKQLNVVAILSFSAIYLGPLDADALISSAIYLTLGLIGMDLLFLRRYRQARLPTKEDPYVEAI